MQIRPYQQDTLNHLLNSKHEREVVCLPTGAGKTVVFTQFCKLSGLNVLILVNRTELLQQTAKTLGTHCIQISPKEKYKLLPVAKTYIAMVETLARRKALLQQLKSRVDVLIVDECHIGNFNKLLSGFKRIIGFSATPMSSKKKESLKDHYFNLNVFASVKHLIENKYLTPAITYAPKTNVENHVFKLNKSKTDYDENEMGEVLSNPIYLKSLLKYIERERTIVYNANVQHSKEVASFLCKNGFNAKHIDGTTPKEKREEIISWIYSTEDAILCNVGVLTFGFDCPDVKRIVLNRKTTSIQLFYQMCGRGSRLPISVDKPHFKIIDMVGNCYMHGLWEEDINWQIYFSKKSDNDKVGPSPYKECEKCEAIVHISTKTCPHCEYEFKDSDKRKIAYDDEIKRIELEIVNANRKNIIKQRVEEILAEVLQKGHKPASALHIIAKNIYDRNPESKLDKQVGLMLEALPFWCKATQNRHNKWYIDYAASIMISHNNARKIKKEMA